MLDFEHSIPTRVSEAPGESEFAFAALVRATATLCVAERDVSGSDSFDPAFDDWFREAESARAAVVSAAEAVILSMTLTATDRRFRIVALHFEAMLLTQDASTYALYSDFLTTTGWLYNVAGRGTRAGRATILLQQFRHNLGLLLHLPDYAPEQAVAAPMATMAA